MPIKLRGKTWHIDSTIRGVEIRQTLRTSDKKEALKRAKALEQAVWEGQCLPTGAAKGVTLGDAFADHYAAHWAVKKDAKGVCARFVTLTRFIPSNTAVSAIDRAMIMDLVRDMRAATYTRTNAPGAKQYPYSRATINRVLALLQTLLNELVKVGTLAFAPVMPKTTEEGRKAFITEQQEALMWNALATSPNPNHQRCLRLFRFLLESGCRMGEAMGLQWRTVDLERLFVVLVDTKSGKDVGKALTQEAAAILREELDDGYHKPFEGIGETMYRNAWEHALGAAELTGQGIVRHSLRHTVATRLVTLGVPLSNVQKFLGHRSYKTTLGYAHLSDEESRPAAAALDSVRNTCAGTRVLRG